MCFFEYKKFRSCGHVGIEVNDFCDEALWKAGLQGELQICIPEIFTRSLEWAGEEDHEPPQRTVFEGYDGHCNMCTIAYQLPRAIPERNFDDFVLDYSQPHNIFDPDETGPYILTRSFFSHIPDLLRVRKQIELAAQSHGPCITFPPIVEQTSWSELRKSMPLTIKGILGMSRQGYGHDNAPSVVKYLLQLDLTEGVTSMDKCCIQNAIRTGFCLETLYDMMFRHRGVPYGNYNNIVQRLQAENATEEAVARPDPQVLAETSDISSLTDLTNTPELSDSDICMLSLPLSPQPPKPADKAKDEQAACAFRKGNQAKATNLARTAIQTRSPREGKSSKKKTMPATSVPKKSATSAVKIVSARQVSSVDGPTTDIFKGTQPPSDQGSNNKRRPTPLPRRKPAFEVSGSGSPIVPSRENESSTLPQLMLGQTSPNAGEQGSAGTAPKNPIMCNEMSNKSTGASMGADVPSVRTSTGGNAASETPLPYMEASPAQKEELYRYLAGVNARANRGLPPQDRHKFNQEVRQEVQDIVDRPSASGDPRTPQGQINMGYQHSHNGLLLYHCPAGQDGGGGLPVVLKPMAQPSETRIQQPFGLPQQYGQPQGSNGMFQHPYAGQNFLGAQQPHGVPQQYRPYHQASTLPHAFAPQNRRILKLSRQDVQAWVESTGEHRFSGSSAASAQPAFPPTPGGSQQLAQGLSQNFQALNQHSQPAFPTGFGPQRLANGLPQLSQGPSQALQGAQHPQGFLLHFGPQLAETRPLANLHEAGRVPGSLVDEDNGLQETSREEWDKSLASRKRKTS